MTMNQQPSRCYLRLFALISFSMLRIEFNLYHMINEQTILFEPYLSCASCSRAQPECYQCYPFRKSMSVRLFTYDFNYIHIRRDRCCSVMQMPLKVWNFTTQKTFFFNLSFYLRLNLIFIKLISLNPEFIHKNFYSMTKVPVGFLSPC